MQVQFGVCPHSAPLVYNNSYEKPLQEKKQKVNIQYVHDGGFLLADSASYFYGGNGYDGNQTFKFSDREYHRDYIR
jgi:hypothetical protein